jgi:arabinofuranosyltransferase
MVRKKRPPSRKRPARRRPLRPTLIALCVSAVVLVLVCAYIIPFFPDDAYISFRYSENLVDGYGLTFNPGDARVEAYSNFLWILIGAALYAVGASLPAATPVAGTLLALACLYVFWLLLRRRFDDGMRIFLPLLLFALSGPFLMYAVSGMETALFALMLLLVVYVADGILRSPPRPAQWAAITALGLLTALTRPEGVVVLPLVLAYLFLSERGSDGAAAVRRGVALSMAAFLVAYAGYTAWRVSYFGAWLPTPFISKGYDAYPIVAAWKRNFLTYFVRGSSYEHPVGYYYAALLAAGAAGLSLRTRNGDGRRGEGLAWGLAVVMCLLYLNFVDWMPAMRYHAPLVGLMLLPSARLLRLLPEWMFRRGATVVPRGFALLVAVAVLAGANGLIRSKSATSMMTEGRVECLIPLGEWLREAVPRGSTLAIGDVGAVPYYSRLNTLDINRESLTDAHIARTGFTIDYALGRRPDVVALTARGVFSPKMDPLHFGLYRDPRFGQDYRFVGTVRHRWLLDRSYWVFVRKTVRMRRDVLARFPTGIGDQFKLGFDLGDGSAR